MDKLNPTFQETALLTQNAENVSGWYTTQTQATVLSPTEAAWMHAQGWTTYATVTVNGTTTYFMRRRVIQAEEVLQDLVDSYTSAYNEGRALNDQRYDDLLVVYLAILDKTEDAFNALETDDAAFETAIEALIALITSDHTTYAADVDGDLDDWGDGLLAEINALFDARLAAAKNEEIDRGAYSSPVIAVIQAGIERERARALADANDKIIERQVGLKNLVQDRLIAMRRLILDARERLRTYLRNAKDRQVAVRNAAAEALARFVEARTDSYPDLAQIGQLAASLGAGSAEAYAP